MCGVWALLGAGLPADVVAACLRALRARGPDGAPQVLQVDSSAGKGRGATLGFTRLAINGLTQAGWQPMSDGEVHVVCNGEIYNYKALAAQYGLTLPPGCSDCGVLAPLWRAVEGDAVAFARALDGVFAFILVDTARGVVVVGRDPYGVRPLFQAELRHAAACAADSAGSCSEAGGLASPAARTAECAAFPSATAEAFLQRTEAWAGAPPAVRHLPTVVTAAAAGAAAAPGGSAAAPRAFPLVWSSELRGVIPAVDRQACQRAAAAASGEQAGCDAPFTVAPFPPGTVRTFCLASGAQLREEAYHVAPWVKAPAYGYSHDWRGEGAAAAGGAGAGTGTGGPTHQWPEELLAGAAAARAALRQALEEAVRKRLLSDVPVGALLSGGLDSSLIASIAARQLAASGSGKKLKTFSIGMPGSSDCAHARLVAAQIGSEHHEVIVSEGDFWGAVPEVCASIESFDITSVRASVGNYLVSKYIRQNTDVRVVLNGDGSDECSGSYLYFLNAPSDAAFEQEVHRLLRDIHCYDVLRSDRCVAAWGLEARTPFLDKQFVATYLSVATPLRRPRRGGAAEKQLLREAFDTRGAAHGEPEPYLPPAVLWRRKEAFSDGVSGTEKSWYEVVAERVAAEVFPGQSAVALPGQQPPPPWRRACDAFPAGPASPYTQESVWYRAVFEACYSPHAAGVIPYYWLPRWSGGAKDPSARTLAVYADGPSGASTAAAASSTSASS